MKKTVITYTSRKTNKTYTFEGLINDGTTAVLVDSEGGKHMYSMSTLKKTFKKSEIEIEEPKAEEKPMTRHQKEALKNLRGAYDFVVGGYENSVQDGDMEEMPEIEILFDEVYSEAVSTRYAMVGGFSVSGGSAPICMRLAGKAFIREQLAKFFQEDGYEVPEELTKVPAKKQGHSNFVDGERVNLRIDKDENTVTVRAFTGMLIGKFKVEKETSKTIIVKTHKGKMKFDKTSGMQLDAKNPKFANRIDR